MRFEDIRGNPAHRKTVSDIVVDEKTVDYLKRVNS